MHPSSRLVKLFCSKVGRPPRCRERARTFVPMYRMRAQREAPNTSSGRGDHDQHHTSHPKSKPHARGLVTSSLGGANRQHTHAHTGAQSRRSLYHTHTFTASRRTSQPKSAHTMVSTVAHGFPNGAFRSHRDIHDDEAFLLQQCVKKPWFGIGQLKMRLKQPSIILLINRFWLIPKHAKQRVLICIQRAVWSGDRTRRLCKLDPVDTTCKVLHSRLVIVVQARFNFTPTGGEDFPSGLLRRRR